MKAMIARTLGLTVLLAAGSLAAAAGPASKQPEKQAAGTPLPTDWSHQHLIFSHPQTPEQAARIQKDIRYQLQQRRLTAHRTTEVPIDDEKILGSEFQRHHAHRRGRRMHRDWSVDLGPSATAGAARFPAKYSFSSTTASCGTVLPPALPDFVVYGTSVAGSAGQGDIVAFTNLYSGCGGQVPGDYWSYNTGGQVLTSPVLSFDGTQVAFTQTNGTLAVLVLLRWSAFNGLVQTPATPTIEPPGSYLGCTAPCMTTFALNANSTNSSVYYDYGTDTAWVGDDSGKLHQYTGVFLGTPAEVSGGGWPATVSAKVLTSAVHDDSSGNTFVGDSGGFIYSVGSAGGATASGRLDYGSGFTEGPIIDSSAATLYAFSSNDNTGSAGIFQLSTGFVAGATGTEVKIGTSSSTIPQYNGAFDHSYITAAAPTGNLYVCGNPGGDPTVYQVSINAGVIGGSKAGPILSGTNPNTCSPVTDVYNAVVTGAGLPQEWIFMSVQAAGSPTPCGGFSCVMNFKVTSWQPSFLYNAGQEVLDSNLNIQVADNSGQTSGLTQPTWNMNLFGPTVDGGVHWRNQGPISGQTPPGWTAGNPYAGAFEIIDTNNNIEIAELGGGTSGGTQPVWPLPEGSETFDGTLVWYNLGANPAAALQAPGGTSGIIMDNTVNNPGGSQIYYSTIEPSSCGGGPTGGCAVQASQQGLK